MKPVIFTVVFVVLVFAIGILAQTQTESVEQELIKLENEWGEAVVKRDACNGRMEGLRLWRCSSGHGPRHDENAISGQRDDQSMAIY